MVRTGMAGVLGVIALLTASPAAVAADGPRASGQRGCPNREYFSAKVDHYANDIKVSSVSCRVADSLLQHDLHLAGWRVGQHLLQASTTTKLYRVSATHGRQHVTLIWSVLAV